MNVQVMAYAAYRYQQLANPAIVAYLLWLLTRVALLRLVSWGLTMLALNWRALVISTGMGLR